MSIKPPSGPPRGSEPPKAEDIPSGGLEKRHLSIDQFMEELTAVQRAILKEYLVMSDDCLYPVSMRRAHGAQIDWLAYKVQELVESDKSSFDDVRNILLMRLNDEKSILASHFRRERFLQIENDSPDEVGQLMANMTEAQNATLSAYLEVDRDDRQAVTGLLKKYGTVILEVDYKVTLMAENLGCPVDELRQALLHRSRGGRVVIDNLRKKVIIDLSADPRRQETVLIHRKPNQPAPKPEKKGLLERLLGKKKL